MAVQNLTLYRGTSYNMTYTHVEPMTGGSVYFTIKPTQYDDDLTDAAGLPKKTVTSFTTGIATDGVTSITNGKASWQLTDSDMYLAPGTYYYDIVYQASDNESFPPIFTGKIKLLPHTTNRNATS